MVEIEKPRIECVENPGDGSYGKYVVEPLERGYGTTLGNSLRRILLSSLPGTAVTSIKIAGVQHEFSTIPGVKEDVTQASRPSILRPAASVRSPPVTSRRTARWRSSIRICTSPPWAPMPASTWS